MAKKGLSYKELMRMAENYGVSSNALFIAAANQYTIQQKMIDMIRKEIDSGDGLLTVKEYVKNRENLCINPLVKELPKHSDSANKTLTAMLDIIVKLGHEPERVDELTNFMNE